MNSFSNSNAFRAVLKFDTVLPYLLALIIVLGFTGCSEDGARIIDAPADGSGGGDSGYGDGYGQGGSGSLNPPNGSSGSGNNNQCLPLPYTWNITTYTGCHGSQNFAGMIRNQNNKGVPLEYFFEGHDHVASNGNVDGHYMVLTKPASTDCGPARLTLVTEEFLQIGVRDSQGKPLDAEFYTVDYSITQLIWTELHGGVAPSVSDPYEAEWSDLLIDIVECKDNPSNCELKNRLKSVNGFKTPQDAVSNVLVSPDASAEFCYEGPTQVVAISLPQ